MTNLGLLILRLYVGTMMAGHGSQKLFGWFKGGGLAGTAGSMEKLGLQPGAFWGTTAAVGEFSGGTLTALGLFHPIGPQNIAAAMCVATRRAHWRLPLWAREGGPELPLTNLAAAVALLLAGPGKYSFDRAFGIRLPKWFVAMTYVASLLVTGAALFRPEIVRSVLAAGTPDNHVGGGGARAA